MEDRHKDFGATVHANAQQDLQDLSVLLPYLAKLDQWDNHARTWVILLEQLELVVVNANLASLECIVRKLQIAQQETMVFNA
jgi:hypothetical protein